MTGIGTPNVNGVFRARWVFPGSSEPLENGTVECHDGAITAVHNKPDPNAVDLGLAAIIPGLVNAHTHLDLTDVPAPFPATGGFPDWVGRVIAHRVSRDDAGAAVAAGLDELDITSTMQAADTVPAAELDLTTERAHCVRVTPFAEYIGLTADRIDDAHKHVSELAASQAISTESRDVGISPHAPYSVDPDLFAQLVAVAAEGGMPVMSHLAETREELQLLHDGDGPLATMLKDLGVWPDGTFRGGRCVRDYLEMLSAAPRALIAHGNYLSDADISYLCSCPSATVVYCPRTHAHFRHAAHPWHRLLDAGVNVALGTDGRSSNPDLDVWQEALFLREKHPAVSPETLLQMATVNGSLGLHGKPSPIEAGFPARFSVIALREAGTDPWASLFAGTRAISLAAVHWQR